MKKLFVAGLSALLVFGVASCGTNGGVSYDETVRTAKDADGNDLTIHALGGYGEWDGTNNNKMQAVSVKAVSEVNKDLADKLAKKSLRWVYMTTITVPEADVSYTKDYWDAARGEKVTVNGKYAIKAGECSYDAADEQYSVEQWIPNAGDKGKPANVEDLCGTIFFPNWAKDPDEHDFSWANDPVITTGQTGAYTFVVAKYTATSATGVYGYGFGLFKN